MARENKPYRFFNLSYFYPLSSFSFYLLLIGLWLTHTPTQQEFAASKSIPYFETSAKSGEGITQLWNEVAKKLAGYVSGSLYAHMSAWVCCASLCACSILIIYETVLCQRKISYFVISLSCSPEPAAAAPAPAAGKGKKEKSGGGGGGGGGGCILLWWESTFWFL